MTIETARVINDALARHGYDDWYRVLLEAALLETDGDVARSIKIADDVVAQGATADGA